ncbi:MAG TPA: DUF4386 domain-containing protein [Anaerolineae bacterium]|nr:DUF4386 domain-containing protein [Anaerolineae bacterium]
MHTNKNIARTMGILYIIGTVAGILSRVLTGPLLSAGDILRDAAANEGRVTLAALLVMTMGIALTLIPVVAYPVLKKYDEILALGYAVFRGALEGATYMGITVSWLLLLPLSRIYLAGGVNAAGAQTWAKTLLEAPELGAVLMIVFGLGGLMFYALLYRARLVPRWLSVWGLVAILMNIAAGLLAMFGVFSPVSGISNALQVPIFFQEMALAVWFIVKGFDPKAVAE